MNVDTLHVVNSPPRVRLALMAFGVAWLADMVIYLLLAFALMMPPLLFELFDPDNATLLVGVISGLGVLRLVATALAIRARPDRWSALTLLTGLVGAVLTLYAAAVMPSSAPATSAMMVGVGLVLVGLGSIGYLTGCGAQRAEPLLVRRSLSWLVVYVVGVALLVGPIALSANHAGNWLALVGGLLALAAASLSLMILSFVGAHLVSTGAETDAKQQA